MKAAVLTDHVTTIELDSPRQPPGRRLAQHSRMLDADGQYEGPRSVRRGLGRIGGPLRLSGDARVIEATSR